MSFKVTRSVPKGSAKAKKIASSVSVVDATGSVTYTDLSGSTSHTYVSAGVGYTALAGIAKYVSIIPSAVTLGYYLLRHEDFDFATIADIVNVTYSKNLFDEVSVVGDKTIFYSLKAPSDYATVTDVPALNLAKEFGESFAVTDLYSYQVSFIRKPQEVIDASELFEKATTKAFSESSSTDDSIDKLAFGKGIAELPQATDTPSIGIEKPTVTDAASAGTLDPIFAYHKKPDDVASYTDDLRYGLGYHLYDYINATDDYMGESNVDDDQTMHFGKTVIDNGSVSELFSRSIAYKRSLYDLFSSQDTTTLAYSKPVQDSASGGTLFYRQVSFHRNFYNTAVPSDDIALFTSRVLQDNGTAVENAVKSSGKVNNDSASFIDSGKLFWQSYVEDPTYFADDYVGNSQNF